MQRMRRMMIRFGLGREGGRREGWRCRVGNWKVRERLSVRRRLRANALFVLCLQWTGGGRRGGGIYVPVAFTQTKKYRGKKRQIMQL